MIDEKRFNAFLEEIKYDEDHKYLPNLIANPSDFGSWDQVKKCFKEPWVYDCRYLTKSKSFEQTVGAIKVNTIENDPNDPVVGLTEQLENDHSILITNFENMNSNCKNLINFFMSQFYLDFDWHGVWPVRKNHRSGHAHLYCGHENSNSFSPHCDAPHNFIVQVEGESEAVVYENRAFGLSDSLLLHDLPDQQKREIMENLRVAGCYKLKPGDVLYIPSRQYHYFKPLTKRISISFPFMLKGPLAC